jgi:predicted nucleotidyltransferase component of viral defense system
MTTEARAAGVVARRIHLVVAIDRLLARLLGAAPPGSWVVKGGYANHLRRPDSARLTEDLDLRIDAAIETAPEMLAAGFDVDADDDFTYEVVAAAAPLLGPLGGGLRFVVVARLAGTQLVRFKVDVSAADVVVDELEEHLSDPVVVRLGFQASRFPVYPIAQHVAEKLHALTMPRDMENTRARDLVDLAWFIRHFTFRSDALIDACVATFEHRATHPWPPALPDPPPAWARAYETWRKELDLADATLGGATSSINRFLEPVLAGAVGRKWDPATQSWSG